MSLGRRSSRNELSESDDVIIISAPSHLRKPTPLEPSSEGDEQEQDDSVDTDNHNRNNDNNASAPTPPQVPAKSDALRAKHAMLANARERELRASAVGSHTSVDKLGKMLGSECSPEVVSLTQQQATANSLHSNSSGVLPSASVASNSSASTVFGASDRLSTTNPPSPATQQRDTPSSPPSRSPRSLTREKTSTLFSRNRRPDSSKRLRLSVVGKTKLDAVAPTDEQQLVRSFMGPRARDSSSLLTIGRDTLVARLQLEAATSSAPLAAAKKSLSGTVTVKSAFGSALSDLVGGTVEVPLFVSFSLAYLSSNLFVPGLYGSSTQTWMKEKVTAAQTSWNESNRIDVDPLVAAETLKSFISSLPESLFLGLGPEILEACRVPFDPYVNGSLHSIIALLPRSNRLLLKVLFEHLFAVVSHSAANQMTLEKMSKVWEPVFNLDASAVSTLIDRWKIVFTDETMEQAGLDYVVVAGRCVIKWGRLEALLEKVLDPYYRLSDPAFFDCFLTTFPYFTDATTLLRLLVRMYLRFTKPPPQPAMREKIVKFMLYWFEYFLDPAGIDQEFIATEWEQFLAVFGGLKGLSAFDQEMLAFFKAFKFEKTAVLEKLKRFSVRRNSSFSLKLLNPLEFTVEDLAHAMCHVDHALFVAIQPIECLGNSYLDSAKAVNFSNLTAKFNQWSAWVASSVVSVTDANARVDVINHWIGVARLCVHLFNFNSAYAVIAGLNVTPVQRLKSSWKRVPKRFLKKKDKLDALYNMEQNYRNYKHALLVASEISGDEAVVPYLGLYSKYLYAIEVSAPTFDKATSAVNYSKMRALFSQMREMLVFQKRKPYPRLAAGGQAEKIFNLIAGDFLVLTEDEAYKKSLEIEPREKV